MKNPRKRAIQIAMTLFNVTITDVINYRKVQDEVLKLSETIYNFMIQ